MIGIVTDDFLESACWTVLLFVAYLLWRGLSLRGALWPPLEGLAWACLSSAALALPLSLLPRYGSYERAWQGISPWLILAMVPIHVWRKVPAALLPKVTLSELIFWNVTVTAMSFGAWAAARMRESEPLAILLWGFLWLIWLWPTALALLLKSVSGRVVQLLKLPLIFYFWISLLYWLLGPLLADRHPAGGSLLDFADSVFRSFAAIQCFAILYLLYYAFVPSDDLDFEASNRVGDAISNALEIDEWQPLRVLPATLVYGLVICGFVWLNVARAWTIPTYWLLVVPYVISAVLAEHAARDVAPTRPRV